MKKTFRRFWYVFFILVAATLFSVIAVKIVDPIEYPNRDFFTFWLSGRLALLGQNPYDSQIWIAGHHQFGASWIPNATFIYPLPVSLLFIPLGSLPLYQAYIIWDILSQFMIVLALALLIKLHVSASSKHLVFPLMAGVMLFRPTILTLNNGQISGLLLLLIVCTIYLWEKGHWKQGAVFLAMLALKPNLGVPIILLLSIYLIQQKQISALITGAISLVVLFFIGVIQNYNWLIDFFNAGSTKLSQTFGYSPTVWGISNYFCKFDLNCAVGYGIPISLLFLVGYLYLLIKKSTALSPDLVVGLAVILTLLLTPYIWAYDQLLLVTSIATLTTRLVKDGHRYLPASLIFIVVDILAFILLGIGDKLQHDFWSVCVPLFMLGLLTWYLSSKRPLTLIASVG